jgi:hypothetical protein
MNAMKGVKGMRIPSQHQAGPSHGGMKKRKKGGPWGLIKAR